jgi:hypothetical protein
MSFEKTEERHALTTRASNSITRSDYSRQTAGVGF